MKRMTRFLALTLFCLLFLTLPSSAMAADLGPCSAAGFPSNGGALTSGTYTLTADCSPDWDFTVDAGSSVTVIGNGHTLSAKSTERFFNVVAGGTLEIRDLTLSDANTLDGGSTIASAGTLRVDGANFVNNRADYTGSSGGAIFISGGDATITNSTFRNNQSENQGGAIMMDGALLSLSNVIFRDNYIYLTGGALYVKSGVTYIDDCYFVHNRASIGGAIYNSASVLINRSTFSENSSDSDSAYGGAIYQNGTMTVNNSTFYGNTARHNGGAIFAGVTNTTTIANSTFSRNDSDYIGGLVSFGTLYLAGSVFANSGPESDYDCSSNGTHSSGGYNFIERDDSIFPCGVVDPDDIGGYDPGLSGLGSFGGPTQTMLPGDPLVDRIPPGTTAFSMSLCGPADQRNFSEPFGAACDIGSVERQPLRCESIIHDDGRINARQGCAPLAIMPDGEGGFSIDGTIGSQHELGSAILTVTAAQIAAGLAVEQEPTAQILIAEFDGIAVYVTGGGWVKVEMIGDFGMEFDPSLLTEGDPLDWRSPVTPYTLPDLLPATGGPPVNSSDWRPWD